MTTRVYIQTNDKTDTIYLSEIRGKLYAVLNQSYSKHGANLELFLDNKVGPSKLAAYWSLQNSIPYCIWSNSSTCKLPLYQHIGSFMCIDDTKESAHDLMAKRDDFTIEFDASK